MGARMNLKKWFVVLQILPATILFALVAALEHSNPYFVAYLAMTITNLVANICAALFKWGRKTDQNCNSGRFFSQFDRVLGSVAPRSDPGERFFPLRRQRQWRWGEYPRDVSYLRNSIVGCLFNTVACDEHGCDVSRLSMAARVGSM